MPSYGHGRYPTIIPETSFRRDLAKSDLPSTALLPHGDLCVPQATSPLHERVFTTIALAVLMRRALSNLGHVLGTLRRHPLTRDRYWQAVGRYLRWQVGSRLQRKPVPVPWVNEAKLLLAPGMWGATMNHYCGLQDFGPMAFLLHLLRPEDLFLDVGANVGAYTVLASGVVGARSIAVEPGAHASGVLEQNAHLNAMNNRVDIHRVAIGAAPGRVRFTQGLDTLNHVATEAGHQGAVVETTVTTIDALVSNSCPTLLKLDTEGYETPALEGAAQTLANQHLLGLLLELEGHGQRYGFDETKLLAQLAGLGFAPYEYLPFKRVLRPLAGASPPAGNVLLLRLTSLEEINRRLSQAAPFTVRGLRV